MMEFWLADVMVNCLFKSSEFSLKSRRIADEVFTLHFDERTDREAWNQYWALLIDPIAW